MGKFVKFGLVMASLAAASGPIAASAAPAAKPKPVPQKPKAIALGGDGTISVVAANGNTTCINPLTGLRVVCSTTPPVSGT